MLLLPRIHIILLWLCNLHATFAQDEIREYVKPKQLTLEEMLEQFRCTETTCGKRGFCHLNDMNKAICDCYWQYYSGDRCNQQADLCKPSKRYIAPACYAGGIVLCTPTYGLNNCVCFEDFFGPLCQFSTSMYGHKARTIKNPYGVIIVVPLEPTPGTNLPLNFGVMDPGSATRFEMIIEGVVYTFDGSEFEKVESNKQIIGQYEHMLGNETLRKFSQFLTF